jgi:two-component system NtrC family sensor kinase
MRQVKLGLAAKLAICVVASTAAFFALFGYINLRAARSHSERLIEQSAQRITDIILRSTRYQMLHNDRDALYAMVQDMGHEPGIHRIRVFNQDGRIAFSSDSRDVNTLQPVPSERTRTFTDAAGRRVLGAIRPIENSADCANAACHQHPASQKVLGVIDADLSLATVDAQMTQHQTSLAYFLTGAIVFGSALAAAFIWTVVYRPVKALIDGTHRVAGGDLDYRLPVTSADELGDLAASFNKMTTELAGVQAKIEAEVRRKTDELEKAHKSLLKSEKMASIGKLAATVAHEINNPLFGILTYARLVLRGLARVEGEGREEMAEQLQTIERESKRCGDLVKNLLTFSRQAPSHREPNDLNTVVHRAVMLVKHKLDMQSFELVETLAEDMPPVECDANQIQQVVLVLLVNASEALVGRPSGSQVPARLEVSTEPEGVVRVKDNGSGIPADVLPRIFDPFFTTKEDQNRTGLGLAVAYSIVEQHGGEITVQSEPGKGTEFRVELVARPSGSQVDPVTRPSGSQVEKRSSQWSVS